MRDKVKDSEPPETPLTGPPSGFEEERRSVTKLERCRLAGLIRYALEQTKGMDLDESVDHVAEKILAAGYSRRPAGGGAVPMRAQVEELERCDPDFGVDGIEVVGGMSSRRSGAWLLRSDVLALFDAVSGSPAGGTAGGEDSARLDWLDGLKPNVIWGGNSVSVFAPFGEFIDQKPALGHGATFRAAIDAARASETKR